jgi:uncharacterized protein (TIGR03083 family)
MENPEYLAALERDGHAFLASCTRAPRGAKIEACPEWDRDDLLYHLTEVHHFWRTIVETRAESPKDVVALTRRDAAELPALYSDGLDRLLRALRDTDPSTPVWTWADQKDVAFIIRRQAQETAVHRWDADLAAKGRGPRPVLEPQLASDGVDEFLEHMIAHAADGATLDGTVHIHCTDVAGEWLVTPSTDGLVITREHAKGDAAIRGEASDLNLVMWRRAPLTAVEVIGVRAVAEQLVAYASLE